VPKFNVPRPVRNTKILYLGHTGAGKTGSLCSLSAAGYIVRILDLDAGTELIDDYMMNPKSIYLHAKPGLWTTEQAASAAERISYVTITEGHRILGTRAVPKGDSWAKIQNQLNNWKDGSEVYGNIATWDSDVVLVIDGLSRLCESAMNFQLSLNQRLVTGPQVGNSGANDYTQAYKLILEFLDLLKSTDIKCNIIMICHIAFLDAPENAATGATRNSKDREMKGFPQTVGRMISPKIGQYFNHSLMAKSIGRQHIITTNTDDGVDLKNVAPLRVRESYPLATGLAEYFRDIRAVSYSGQAGEVERGGAEPEPSESETEAAE